MRAAGSVSLALDPDLGAIEGVGGTQAQALVGGGKHTQTMVVGVPKAINGNGLKVDAILGDVQVKATLCRPQIVQQLDSTGYVPHRDVLEHKVVRELDGLGQGIGVAGAVGIHSCQGLHQGLQVVPLVLPLGGGPLQQVAVDELAKALHQAAGIVGAHIQLAVVDLHAPDVLVLVAAKAGLQAGEAAVGEHLGGVAHHQLHILVLVHAVQVHGLVQVGVEEPAIQAAAKLAGQKADLARLERGYRVEEIAQARASVVAATAVAENASINLKRVAAMRASNAISQKELDNARAAERERQARRSNKVLAFIALALFVAVCVVMVAKAYSEEPAAEPAAPEASAAPAAILPTELLFTAAAEEEYMEDPQETEKIEEALLAQGIPEADRVAQALDLYVNGSLNFFNHRTTVDISNRLVCFDIKGLGKNLKKPGMLIVQDAVWNTVTVNRSIGRATWYFVDEFHLLLKEEQTAAYSAEIWKRFRKWGGVPTGATQNPKDLLHSPEIENILENSDFIYLLNLSAGDRKLMTERLNISAEQLAYVTNADPGSGLLFFQNVILPFKDEFPKDTELYRLLTTKPSEVSHDGENG